MGNVKWKSSALTLRTFGYKSLNPIGENSPIQAIDIISQLLRTLDQLHCKSLQLMQIKTHRTPATCTAGYRCFTPINVRPENQAAAKHIALEHFDILNL